MYNVYIFAYKHCVQSNGDMHVMKLSKTTRNKLLSLILWGKWPVSHWYHIVCPTAQVTVHKLVCCCVMVMSSVLLATIYGLYVITTAYVNS